MQAPQNSASARSRRAPIVEPLPALISTVTIRRVVPNLSCRRVETTRDFYVRLLGFDVAMDMGWIVTLASPENPTAQISLSAGEPDLADDGPVLTIEVRDVDDVHARALAAQVDVVLSLRDEDWGVRRCFLRDPDGRVVNVMTQPGMMA